MTVIAANVRVNSKLTEIERGFAIPLVEVAQQLVPGMIGRITRGVSSTGTFAPLGAYSVARPGKGLFWVPPDLPQPAGFVVRPTSGELDGWAGYRTYKAYADALGGGPRKFTQTRQLMQSLAPRVLGPGRVKITFYGAHRASRKPDGTQVRQSNTSVAYLASRNEPAPMLAPTRDELVAIARSSQNEVAAGVLQNAADAQSVRQLGQRYQRVQKRMAASTYARG